VMAVEGLAITAWGATPGMRTMGVRIATIGSATNPSWRTALQRTFPVALCYPVFLPGTLLVVVMPIVLLTSVAMSPLRRGFHDRMSGTVVVQANAPARITEAMLDTWWQPNRNLVMSPWGRVPDVYDRRRARAHRVDGSTWLAFVIMLTTIASVGFTHVPWLWLWTTLIWLAVVVVDEAVRLSTSGSTPGHDRFGYRVVDMGTGEPPTRRRAFIRSAVLAPLLYIPPLQLLAALWVQASALHRGPHDLAAGTIVVEPGFRPHSFVAPPLPVPYGAPPWAATGSIQPSANPGYPGYRFHPPAPTGRGYPDIPVYPGALPTPGRPLPPPPVGLPSPPPRPPLAPPAFDLPSPPPLPSLPPPPDQPGPF
ncbi:MAG: RDD family protein, partial [Actinobacteria bacterium]|nr:RDD family protein [Actinomycetota bacterium]